MHRTDLVSYLDDYMHIGQYSDRSNNGLQVQGVTEVTRVAVAVDACIASFRQATDWGAHMLITHHGLFWSEHMQLIGPHLDRVRLLIEAGLSLYAAHIPLDAHPEVGNNIQLANMIGLASVVPWGAYKNTTIGFLGDLPVPERVSDLYQRLEDQIGEGNLIQARTSAPIPAHALCSRVAICSGFGVSMIDDAVAAGADTLITGETSHQWYQMVAERDLNVIYAGHYATETVGVKALARHLEARFDLATTFIDLPTGL